MGWALIFMICNRGCIPNYVVVYKEHSECIMNIENTKWYEQTQKYCVPIVVKK